MCYGGAIDGVRGMGTLYLEDVSPATQGDVLVDPGNDAAHEAIRTIARVHATSWREQPTDRTANVAHWQPAIRNVEHWRDRSGRAQARYPAIVTASVQRRLLELPERVAAAAQKLTRGAASWIHGDAHLDNVLWRPDGRCVLLDWGGAMIGPPTVDAARFIVESPPEIWADQARRASLSASYQEQLRTGGMPDPDVDRVPGWIDHAIHLHAQGVVGWAGRPETQPITPRMASLRENALLGVVAWLDGSP